MERRAAPIGLKLSASPLTLPRTKRASESPREAPSIPEAPTSLWAAASNTPPEERARRESVGRARGLADRASAPRANADTRPKTGVEDEDGATTTTTTTTTTRAKMMVPPRFRLSTIRSASIARPSMR